MTTDAENIEWTAAEREAVTDICTHEGLGKACDRCRDTISDALTTLAPFVAERERQAAARALRRVLGLTEDQS